MNFWKFEYLDVHALEIRIREGSLPPPNNVRGLKNTFAHPRKSMSVGDGAILTSLNGEEGKYSPLVTVRSLGSDVEPPIIDWTATTKTVFPTQGVD
ncbi:MAG: hypothetical protein JSR23_03005 [Proteobacteria bacterium]|nr:hypothetical protein [Pseudomonadota bacterium]